MRAQIIAAVVISVMLLPAAADVQACGDKYARVGRSSRLQGYKPIHPASMLIYTPAGAKQGDIKDYEKTLVKAGHQPTFVPRGTDVARAVTEREYDLLIVHQADAAAVKKALANVPGAPTIVTILPEKSKQLEPEVRKDFHFVIKPYSMSKWDALETMDDAMTARLQTAPAPDLAR